ncbi:MAG TPA: hypothetical protein VEA16_02305 [Vicinamibacterales bacterium]|nr:hypothetical protein [Vicinamibacterales bacterium]
MTHRSNAVGIMLFAGALAAAGWLASALSGTPLVGYDDANIFFVYARNLLDGHGFVYYPGGERVEGFTSLAWVLICAAAMALTSRFEVVLFAINCLALATALWSLCDLVHHTLRRHTVPASTIRPATAGVFAIALTVAAAFTPGSIAWNVLSLMDSGLWSSLLLLTAVTILRAALDETATPGRLLPVLIVALTLTRPEAMLWGPLFIAIAIVAALLRGESPATAIRTNAASLLAFGATTAFILAWRLSYFGYPLPNTFYAKAGDPLANRIAEGQSYLIDFAIANPAVPLALAASVWTAIVAYRHRGLFACCAGLLTMLLAGLAVPVFEGGDHFGFWRMFQPIVPLIAMQAAATAAVLAIARPNRPQLATIVVAITIVLALMPWRHWTVLGELSYASRAPGGSSSTPRVEIGIAHDMRHIGAAFSRTFPKVKPRVGVIVAGGFAYSYDGPTIDLMGLNNVAMAHSPGPRSGMRGHAAFHHDVFFSLAPDVLLLSLWSPERPDWFEFPMLSGVFSAPPHQRPDYFRRRSASMAAFDAGVMKGLLRIAGQDYAWASVRRSDGAEWIHAIFNRAFLERLRQAGYEIALPGVPPA